MNEQWLSIDGLADLLNVGRSWVRNKVTAREIPHRRVGRHVRFAPEDIAAAKEQFFEPAITAPTSRAVRRVRVTTRRAPSRAA